MVIGNYEDVDLTDAQGNYEDVDLTDAHAVRFYEMALTDGVYFRMVLDELEERRRKSPTRRQFNLYYLVNKSSVDPSNIFSGIGSKRHFVKEAGYRTLNGPCGEQVTIDSAKESRIGQMVRDTCKRVSTYVND